MTAVKEPAMTATPEKRAESPSAAPADVRRRAALARLGLAATAIYAAPVILKLNQASAKTSHCHGGNSNCGGGGNSQGGNGGGNKP
jgi:hypothetical protein